MAVGEKALMQRRPMFQCLKRLLEAWRVAGVAELERPYSRSAMAISLAVLLPAKGEVGLVTLVVYRHDRHSKHRRTLRQSRPNL